MRIPFFDRLDLWVTKALLILVGVVVPLYSVGWPLARWLQDKPLHWELEGLGPTSVPDRLVAQEGVTLRGADTVVVHIADAGAGPWLASLLPGAVLSVTVGLGAWLLLRLVRRIEQGQPFVSASATSLRLLAATVLVGSLAVSLGLGVAEAVISQRALDGADPVFGFEVSFVAFVGALLMLALAEAFAQGVRLQEDVEGLV